MNKTYSEFLISPMKLMKVEIIENDNDDIINQLLENNLTIEDFYKKVAENIIDSMQNQHCIRLLESLRNHCDELIEEDEIRKNKLTEFMNKK